MTGNANVTIADSVICGLFNPWHLYLGAASAGCYCSWKARWKLSTTGWVM